MQQTDLHILEKAFAAMGCALEGASSSWVKIYYRNNPDGSLRWAWPAGSPQPLFLRFYHTGSRRARLLAFLIRILFAAGLQRFFASGHLYISPGFKDYAAFLNRMNQQWAFFAGTRGATQTALFCSDSLFYKIPAGEDARNCLQNEYRQHRQWQNFPFRHLRMARAYFSGDVLVQQDIAANGKRADQLTALHWNVLQELASLDASNLVIEVHPAWKAADAQLQFLRDNPHPHIPAGIIEKLYLLKKSIHPCTVVPASFSHGDFTPWNMLVQEQQIALVDWEMASAGTPLFFDALHFVYQQATLVDRVSPAELTARITSLFESTAAKAMQAASGASPLMQHKLYLLFTACSNLVQYATRTDWRIQNHWSTAAWNAQLTTLLVADQQLKQRPALVSDIFDYLQPHNYAVVKWMAGSRFLLPEESDLDICIERATVPAFLHWLRQHPFVQKLSLSDRSFMKNCAVWLKDGSFLSIDLVWQIKRRELEMMDAATLLQTADFNGSRVRVPSPAEEFSFVWLFYLLNKSPMPAKYRTYFRFRSAVVSRTLNMQCQWLKLTGMRHYAELFDATGVVRSAVVRHLQLQPANRGWKGFANKLRYSLDTLREKGFRRGMVITFSGVDGAGKSTVIEQVRTQVEKRFRRKVVVLRHRPAVLPMLRAWKEGRVAAEKNAAERLPRQGTNKNILSSLLRFGYYYCDYLFGQFVVQVKYVWRGYIVLYDRYYFDFINDGKRSNISLPAWLTRSWYRLLLKPAFNFFLYAKEDTILRRKQELDRAAIQELTARYRALFSSLRRKSRHVQYVAIENEVLGDTLQTIINHLKTKTL